MSDRNVNLGTVLAYLAWGASAVALALAWILAMPYLGMIGVMLSTVAATVTVRTWFVQQARFARNAFELGRDSSRVHGVR